MLAAASGLSWQSGRARSTSGFFATFIEPNTARDDFLHDFRRPRVDAGNSRIGIHPTNPVLVHVTGSAVKLHAIVHDPRLDFAGMQLGLGRNLGRQTPRIVLDHTLI